MSLKLRCPACKTVFAAGTALPGAIVNCPNCKVVIRIPKAPSVKPSQPEPSRSLRSSPKQESEPVQTAKTPWYWVVPVVSSGAAYEIFRRAGWISEKTTKGQFLVQVIVVVLVAAAVAFAVWGIIALIRKALAMPAARPGPQPTPVPPSPPPPPAYTPPPQQDSSGGQWWLHVGGQVTGPFATASVVEAFRLGDFAATTPACPVGGSEWKPIADWHQLAAKAPTNPTHSAR